MKSESKFNSIAYGYISLIMPDCEHTKMMHYTEFVCLMFIESLYENKLELIYETLEH